MGGSWVRLMVALALLVGLTATGLPASAAILMTIDGTVTDPVGRPIEGATVSDGDQSVSTDASGFYQIEESDVSDSQVVAAKLGFDNGSRLVSPIDAASAVDYTLSYTLHSEVTPDAFTNEAQEILSITAHSFAPAAETCLIWTDESTGTTVDLALTEERVGGESTWEGSYTVSSGISDGRFKHTTTAIDCASGVALSAPATGSYVVDSIAPVLSELAPKDRGNTVFDNQRIITTATETGSGIDADTLLVTVEDLTDTSAPAQTPTAHLYHGNLIKSDPLMLTLGHRYQATVTVADRAGNTSSPLVVEFAAIDIDVPQVAPTIDPVEVEGTFDPSTGETNFTFTDVKIDLPHYRLAVDGTPAHAGFGYVGQEINLNDVSITLKHELVTGPETTLATVNPTDWGTRMPLVQAYQHSLDTPDPILSSSAMSVSIPELTYSTKMPAVKAVLTLNSASTPESNPVLTAPRVLVCADPTTDCSSTTYPTPDPFPYYMSDSDATLLNDKHKEFLTETAEQMEAAWGLPICEGVTQDPCETAELDTVVPGLIYNLKAVYEDPQNSLDPDTIVWKLAGIASAYHHEIWTRLDFLHDYPVYFPWYFDHDCELTLPCSYIDAVDQAASGIVDGPSAFSSSASSSTDEERRKKYYDRCFNHEQWNNERYGCYQWAAAHVFHDLNDNDGSRHWIGGYMGSTMGLSDGTADRWTVAVDDKQQSSTWPGWDNVWNNEKAYVSAAYNEWHFNWFGDYYYPYYAYPYGVKRGQCFVHDTLTGNSEGNPWQIESWTGDHETTTNRWFGAVTDPRVPQHDPAKKVDEVEDVRGCWGVHAGIDSYPPDWAWATRLGYGHIDAGPNWEGTTNGGRKGVVQYAFGHNKATTNWEFGCGFGFGVGASGPDVGVSCGWEADADEDEVWSIRAQTDFTF